MAISCRRKCICSQEEGREGEKGTGLPEQCILVQPCIIPDNSTSNLMVFLCNTLIKVHLDLPAHGRMRQRKCQASPVPILKDDWQQPKGSLGLGAPHLANWIGNIAFGKGPC